MKRLRRHLGWIPLGLGCVAIALVLYSLVQPRSALGPIESDHIFERDGLLGRRLQPNLRGARGVFPARPHPLPFRPDDPAYTNAITKRGEYFLDTNSDGFRGTVEYTERPGEGVIRVGTIGDSITFGFGVADDESYPAVLEALLSEHGRYEVINAGVHSYDSSRGLRALRTRLLPYHPDVVTLCLGVNDTVSIPEHRHLEGGQLRLSQARYEELEAEFEANMREMVRLCREQGTQVVLVVPPVNGFFPFPDVTRFVGLTRKVALELDLPLVDLEQAFLQREKRDGLVLVTEGTTQTLVGYRKGEPRELLTVEVDPDRFQFVADEIYAYIDREPVDMTLAFDGSHPNAEGMRLIAQLLEPVILGLEPPERLAPR